MASFSTLDDDLLIFIASHGAPVDLLGLALTCRRLGSKFGAATRERRALARDAKRQRASPRGWSLMDEAARVAMEQTQTAEERVCLPLRHGESWMARYHQLLLLRRPLTFDVLFGDEPNNVGFIASHDKTEVSTGGSDYYQTALSNHIMRAGKHYASFTRTGSDVRVGVFRPTKGWDNRNIRRNASIEIVSPLGLLIRELNERWGDGDVNYCALHLSFHGGDGFWAGKDTPFGLRCTDWQHETFGADDTAGLLLDLDEGVLAVYRNGRRLGVLKSGLAGEYCWGASIAGFDGVAVKITRGSFVPE